ncbi:MAG: hypothetical protein IPL93_12390 [Actinomycetales bacterium]|nr:hypothetical protein [Actinomycetales bacterium]
MAAAWVKAAIDRGSAAPRTRAQSSTSPPLAGLGASGALGWYAVEGPLIHLTMELGPQLGGCPGQRGGARSGQDPLRPGPDAGREPQVAQAYPLKRLALPDDVAGGSVVPAQRRRGVDHRSDSVVDGGVTLGVGL